MAQSPHASNNDLAPYLRPSHADRGDLDDSTREARIERRLGRRLTQSEAWRCRCVRTPPMPLESRAYYHAAGFRLVVTGRRLEMAKNGRFWHGGKVLR
jgi:hypothetical protein